jgi:non-homologous end joining protein Ku
MAARSIASLSLTFGLVSIPVKLYSATESSAAIRFKLMSPGGARVRQQYVAGPAPAHLGDEAAVDRPGAEEPESPPQPEADPAPAEAPGRAAPSRVIDFPSVRQEPARPAAREPSWSAAPVLERSEMVKGYEYEKGRFVLFTAAELKALEAGSRQTIDIVSFLPEHAVDPLYHDKAYFLAPDKGGAKPYSLLLRAMRETHRGALAKWAFRAKEYLVHIRPADGGLVLQQLLYADEVRSIADLDIELVEVGAGGGVVAGGRIAQI